MWWSRIEGGRNAYEVEKYNNWAGDFALSRFIRSNNCAEKERMLI